MLNTPTGGALGGPGKQWRLGSLPGRFLRRQISVQAYLLVLFVLVSLRMLIAFSQRVLLTPQGAPLDDMLMIRGAMSITEGEWLGAYNAFNTAKNMGYAVILAALHIIRLPVLDAAAALWLLCAGLAVRALRPCFPGNLSRAVLFAFLAFQPVSYAQFTMRVYRDNMFPAFCLLCFAGVVGLALRLGQPRARGSVLCALCAGLGLAGAFLLREDGAVVLLFAACALALVALFALCGKHTRKKAAKAVLALCPFAVLAGAVAAFSAVNWATYGIFMVNDLNEGAFPEAYGAMAGVSRAESGFVRRVPVTQEALQRLYDEVPALADLQSALKKGPAFNGFADAQSGEYGGSFYYGLRLAAQLAGKTPTAAAAQGYWRQVQSEVQAAVAEGRLQSADVPPTVLPGWNASLLNDAALEMASGFWEVMLFRDCDPRPRESEGSAGQVEEVAQYLASPPQEGKREGTGEPYYNLLQQVMFALCDALTWAYRVLIWPLLALALWRMFAFLGGGIRALARKQGGGEKLLFGLVMLGLLLSFVVRLAVAAFMETAAFGIGTYLMYLAGGVPALLLLCAMGCGAQNLAGPVRPKANADI